MELDLRHVREVNRAEESHQLVLDPLQPPQVGVGKENKTIIYKKFLIIQTNCLNNSFLQQKENRKKFVWFFLYFLF